MRRFKTKVNKASKQKMNRFFLFVGVVLFFVIGLLLYQKISRPIYGTLGMETATIKCIGTESKTLVPKQAGSSGQFDIQNYPAMGYIGTDSLVAISIMAVGNGEISVTDSQNNTYSLLVKQPFVNNPQAATYLFVSKIVNPLSVFSKVTVKNTSLISMAGTMTKCTGSAQLSVIEAGGRSGYSFLPVSPSLNALQEDAVVGVVGINKSSYRFGLGYPSGSLLSNFECNPFSTSSIKGGVDKNISTVESCLAKVTESGSISMQLNITNTKTPVDWAYAIAVIR